MIKIAIFIFLCGLSLGSVYLFPSGIPQPADIILSFSAVLIFLFSLLKGRSAFSSVPFVWVLLVAWVFLVCLVWSLVLGEYDFFVRFSFWIYNLLIGSSVAFLLSRYSKFRDSLRFSICVALIISGVGIVLSPDGLGRTVGFFNNPNQLAFFSLLGISCLFVLVRFRVTYNPLIVLAIFSGVAGVFAGASLAAIAGFLLVILGYLVANITPYRLVRTLLGLCFVSVFLASTNFQVVNNIYDNVSKRFLVADSKFADISSERNYDRILAFPEYIVLGAGEGSLERFYPHSSLEIHSSFGTLLFCYGVVGLTLFLILLYKALRYAPLSVWLAFSGPLVYSLTHMGLRTTMFWILIAIIWNDFKVSGKNSRSITS